jgi:hypothetical protein
VPGHGIAHDAQSDEGDFCHNDLPRLLTREV